MNKEINSISTSPSNYFNWNAFSKKALKSSTVFWFVLAVLGQWMFAYYILVFYGGTSLQGNFAKWEEQLDHGFISGDFIGNLMIVTHILLAFIITIGGPLQLIPKLRNRFITFHKWNGRLYVIVAFIISFAGLYIIISRGVVGGSITGIMNYINASFICLCAFMTWRLAVKRKMVQHQEWAIRLFLVVSGVWFLRVGFGLWIVFAGGPSGELEYYEEPFFIGITVAHTLLPLFIYEIYRWVKNNGGTKARLAMASGLYLLSLIMGIGIVMITMAFWWPYI